MAYPTIGTEGKVVSWGAGGGLYATILSKIRATGATWNVVGGPQDVSGLDTTTASKIAGLRSVTAQIRGYALATPSLGYKAVVTQSGSGYVTRARSWEWTWATNTVHDITNLPDTAGNSVLWRSFRPDYGRWNGSYTCDQDSATALTPPLAAGASLPTITLNYTDTESIAGSCVIDSTPAMVVRGSPNRVTYNFMGSGSITAAGANSIFGAVTLTTPPWSAGGTAHPLVIASLTGSRTITIADTFITSMTLRVPDPGVPMEVEINIQGSPTAAAQAVVYA